MFNTLDRPACNHEPAEDSFEVRVGIDRDGDSDNAIATAIAATCSPEIPPLELSGAVAGVGVGADADADAAAGVGAAVVDGCSSRSSRLITLIDTASKARTTNTTPMPTTLTVSPSLSNS